MRYFSALQCLSKLKNKSHDIRSLLTLKLNTCTVSFQFNIKSMVEPWAPIASIAFAISMLFGIASLDALSALVGLMPISEAWSDGTSHIVLTPHEFLERLVALVPPPRKNQIRYSGVFAPNAKLREKIVPQKEEAQGTMPAEEGRHPSSRKRMGWAKLLSRVFQIGNGDCSA